MLAAAGSQETVPSAAMQSEPLISYVTEERKATRLRCGVASKIGEALLQQRAVHHERRVASCAVAHGSS